MESFLNRYRNLTVLLLVLCAQLVLLAVQVKNDQDVRIIRVWTVTAVTPAARVIEAMRGGSIGFLRDYVLLRDTNLENKRLQADLDKLKIENIFLKEQLNTADRAKALAIFQSHTASRTLAASIIGTGAGSNSKVVFIDRGTSAGVQRGMAVVVPDGIVGKVISVYPTASEVILVTDSDFAAGVVSRTTLTRGTIKGQGSPLCRVDYVPAEDKIQVGEWLYTSGDDRVFPKGFPVGIVKVVRNAQPFKEILVEPAALQRGLEEVLVLLEGVHQPIPEAPPVSQPVYLAPPPPAEANPNPTPPPAAVTGNTEADKLRQQYKAIGEAQGHEYGNNPPGAKAVEFNIRQPNVAPLATPPMKPQAGAVRPPAVQQPGAAPQGAPVPNTKPAAPPAVKPARPAAAPAEAGDDTPAPKPNAAGTRKARQAGAADTPAPPDKQP